MRKASIFGAIIAATGIVAGANAAEQPAAADRDAVQVQQTASSERGERQHRAGHEDRSRKRHHDESRDRDHDSHERQEHSGSRHYR